MEPAAHLAQRRGAWDVFHELVDQILTSGREGEPPGEELIASLRDFAARRAATGASAIRANHKCRSGPCRRSGCISCNWLPFPVILPFLPLVSECSIWQHFLNSLNRGRNIPYREEGNTAQQCDKQQKQDEAGQF